MEIQRGAAVLATDGPAGHVRHVIIDPQTRKVTHLVVADYERTNLVPIGEVAGSVGSALRLRGTRAQLQGAERFQREGYRAVDPDRLRNERRGAIGSGRA